MTGRLPRSSLKVRSNVSKKRSVQGAGIPESVTRKKRKSSTGNRDTISPNSEPPSAESSPLIPTPTLPSDNFEIILAGSTLLSMRGYDQDSLSAAAILYSMRAQ